ncbi:MAG: ATP-binding cassette domain-containing protein [Promethearchaeota archaeon]
MDYDIEIFNLTKIYRLRKKKGDITALNNINFKVRKGEILGLLGPNGAGKTTLVSILSTLIKPTMGYAEVLGYNILKNPKYIKRNIGVMLGGDMIYYRLTGYKNLEFFCKIYGVEDYKEKIKNIMKKLDIYDWRNQYVSNYSLGMKVKLALGRILIIKPKLMFLDEPMLGLDPKSVRNIINIIKNINKTILITSHQLHIVQQLCNRIVFLNKGKILKIDTPENLKKLISNKVNINIKLKNNIKQLIEELESLSIISNIEIKKEEKEINFQFENTNRFSELFKILKNFQILKFNVIEPSLEDIFIKLSN